VVRALRTRGFEIAAGQDRIKRRVFRIAHLGSIRDADLLALMDALQAVLEELGAAPRPPGALRAAAAAVLA
jgi:aspartate aminotransferase-like enzyme